jgi:hypothetical protein
MKKVIALLSLFLLASLNSANIKLTDSDYTGYSLTSNNSSGFEMELNLGKLDFSNVITEKGEFIQLQFERSKYSNIVGAPKLPIFRELIEFPASSKPEIQIISFNEKEISLGNYGIEYPIIPVQPSYSKSTPADQIKFVINEDLYRINEYSRSGIAEITKSGNLRGVDIGVLEIRPFDYNPVSKTLKVITDIKIKVFFSEIKSSPDLAKAEHYSPYFEGQFSSVINHIPSASKSDLTQYPVTYLIVANEVLNGNAKLQEFIDWKTQKGFNVITEFFSSTATTATVDTWIENQYSSLNPKPSFLLIVGDQAGTYIIPTEQNPPLGSTGGVTVSDLMYSVIGATSSDNRIPSIYVGRFSVNNLTELDAQVDKTIWYEKNQFSETENPGQDFTYLSRVMGVAGVDASYGAAYGNPQIRYGMTYYFNNTYRIPLDGSGVNITGIPYYYPASAGSTIDAEVVSQVSTGVGFYNYTAHGYNGGFADPTFTISNVDNLTNEGEYPLIVGNCCLTGSFRDTECFGESWLNAPNKGAVGFIGASMSTYWDEDLAMGIGEVVTGDVTPTYTPDSFGMYDGAMQMRFPTQGAIRFSGLMAVEEISTSYTSSYWSAYHLFGDPSVMIYMGIPLNNAVSHNPLLSPGDTFFTVQALKGSYVAISDDNGILHGAAVADDMGYAVVPIEPFVSGNAHVVVTSQFKKPYFSTIPIDDLEGPYLTVNNYALSNVSAGSSGTINLELKNLGILPSQGITVSASTLNSYLSLTDYQETYANIAAGDSLNKNSVFSYSVLPNTPDQEKIRIDLTLNDSSKRTYYSYINFVAESPFLEYLHSYEGDVINPGDSKDIAISITNSGSAEISGLTADLNETTGGKVTISAQQSISSIAIGESIDLIFNVDFSTDIQNGTGLEFSLNLTNTSGYDNSYVFNMNVGMTDNFETGDFSENDWYFTGNSEWTVDNTVFYSATHSAKSGAVLDNQSSSLKVDFEFLKDGTISFYKRVSSESGYDKLTFYIDGTAKGNWSGESGWVYHSYPITIGTHTLTWTYAKDGSAVAGSDCAWVDNILATGILLGISEEVTSVPEKPELYQNYPNPFNPSTTIRFSVPSAQNVKLNVYNSNGQLVRNLINNKMDTGYHSVNFNAADLISGIYFCTLEVNGNKHTQKMLLIK